MNYQKILEEVVKKEAFWILFYSVILVILLFLSWLSLFLHYRKKKKSFAEKNKNSQFKSIIAMLIISLISLGILTFFALDKNKFISNIHKDIDNNSYKTYSGYYYINEDFFPGPTLFNEYIGVYTENGDDVFLCIDSLSEWLTAPQGEFVGTIVYGENSGIIVDITK